MSARAEMGGEQSRMSLGNRIKVGAGVLLGVGTVGFGAVQGFELNQDAQAARDQQAREDAANDQACIRFEKNSNITRTTDTGRAVVRLAAMSPRQKDVCDVPEDILGAFDPYDRNTGVGLPLPKGATIVKSDVKVRLPSVSELEASAKDHLDDASSGMSVIDVAERGGATAAGGLFGSFAFIIGAGGLAFGINASRRRQG